VCLQLPRRAPSVANLTGHRTQRRQGYAGSRPRIEKGHSGSFARLDGTKAYITPQREVIFG
jgi:hypothetical protein